MDIRIHAVEQYQKRFAELIAEADFCVSARGRENFWGDKYIVVTDGRRVITIEKREGHEKNDISSHEKRVRRGIHSPQKPEGDR